MGLGKAAEIEILNARSPLPAASDVEETDAGFIVPDHNGQQLAYIYFEDEPGRRSAAKLLTKDEAQRNPLQRGARLARLDCLNLPIVCAIHLMYWDARLDRAPDHVFCSAAARKRHNQIGLAFVEHPLIAQWASFLADFIPLALRDLIRLARDAPARRPSVSYPVSAPRVTVDQHREKLFGVQSIQDADHQSRIIEVATATDQNSHLPCPSIRNMSINTRGRCARSRARSPLNSDCRGPLLKQIHFS
jgi:hypothetical protein